MATIPYPSPAALLLSHMVSKMMTMSNNKDCRQTAVQKIDTSLRVLETLRIGAFEQEGQTTWSDTKAKSGKTSALSKDCLPDRNQ